MGDFWGPILSGQPIASVEMEETERETEDLLAAGPLLAACRQAAALRLLRSTTRRDSTMMSISLRRPRAEVAEAAEAEEEDGMELGRPYWQPRS